MSLEDQVVVALKEDLLAAEDLFARKYGHRCGTDSECAEVEELSRLPGRVRTGGGPIPMDVWEEETRVDVRRFAGWWKSWLMIRAARLHMRQMQAATRPAYGPTGYYGEGR